MGTTALADAKSALSLSIAHNMDSVEPLTSTILATYMGMPTAVAGGTDTYQDASGSKTISYNPTTNEITYYYRRGDVVLQGIINLTTQQMIWNSTLANKDRAKALAQGLKVTPNNTTADLSAKSTQVGQLGYEAAGTLKFPGT